MPQEEDIESYTDAEWQAVIAKIAQEVAEQKKDTEQYAQPQQSMMPDPTSVASAIDHTLLKLDATDEQVDSLCGEARSEGFAAVCVRPVHVSRAVGQLPANFPVASVVGFHEGTYETSAKLAEAALALAAGAHELDVVLNYPQLCRGGYAAVYAELAALRAAAPTPSVKLKLILETSQLASDGDIIAACVLAAAAHWDFVKTSTGFCGSGATVSNVRLMRASCEAAARWNNQPVMRVKASAGIRTFAQAREMLDAGASRLGTSAGVAIVKEAREGPSTRPAAASTAY